MVEPKLEQRAHTQASVPWHCCTAAIGAASLGPDLCVGTHFPTHTTLNKHTPVLSHTPTLLPRPHQLCPDTPSGIRWNKNRRINTNVQQLTHSNIKWNVGFEIADYVHKQTCLKWALPVNRRLSLEPGCGLPANRWPQPALASLRRHVVFS